MEDVSLAVVCSVAFFGSMSHCVGMCGGFLSLQLLYLKDKSRESFMLYLLMYNISRVCAYVILGAIFGYFGSFFLATNSFRSILLFFIGLFLIFVGVSLLLRGKFLAIIENDKLSRYIMTFSDKFITNTNIFNFCILGFLNGFLPCGLVYYFLAMSILSQSLIDGAIIMAIFGLSTIPSMLFFVSLAKIIRQSYKQILFNISIFIIILNGIYLTFLGYMKHG